MTIKDIRNIDKDEVLGWLGLETSSTASTVISTLGTFCLGLVVGGAAALIFAPKPGSELRDDLRDRLRRAPDDLKEVVASAKAKLPDIVGSIRS